jgi:hypothetical protein
MSTYTNVDKVITFKYHFCLLKMELYQSGADSYFIQVFKEGTLESWEFIVRNSMFHAVSTTLAIFLQTRVKPGRNLVEMVCTPSCGLGLSSCRLLRDRSTT